MFTDLAKKITMFFVYLSICLLVGFFCKAFTTNSWSQIGGDPIYVGYIDDRGDNDQDEEEYWSCPQCQALVTPLSTWCANCEYTR